MSWLLADPLLREVSCVDAPQAQPVTGRAGRDGVAGLPLTG